MHNSLLKLQATAKANDESAASLDPMVDGLQKAHEAFLQALQKMRLAENAKGSNVDGVADARAGDAKSAFWKALAALQEGVGLLPPPLADKASAECATLTVLDGLPTSAEGVADVQVCVALAADKHRLATELRARVRAVGDAARSEMPALESALASEEKRGKDLDEARTKCTQGMDQIREALGAPPPSFAVRYPAESATLADAEVPATPFAEYVTACVEDEQICEALRKGVSLAMAKATELKALEEHLLTDCATARERLAPVEKAIALKAKATARHDKAVAEGDGGAALMKAAFEAVPASMPARYPQESDALLQLQLPVLAELEELERPALIAAGVKLAAEKGQVGKELEATVRAELAAARAELATIEAASKAEERRKAKLQQALSDGDDGATLLRTAFRAVPPSVSTRCPEQAVALHLDVMVPFLAASVAGATDGAASAEVESAEGDVANTRERMAAFFGNSGGSSCCVDEWGSGDLMRQALCTLEHCADLAGRQESLMRQIEVVLRDMCETARGALDVAKAKVPAEEMRIFDELRQNASA